MVQLMMNDKEQLSEVHIIWQSWDGHSKLMPNHRPGTKQFWKKTCSPVWPANCFCK